MTCFEAIFITFLVSHDITKMEPIVLKIFTTKAAMVAVLEEEEEKVELRCNRI